MSDGTVVLVAGIVLLASVWTLAREYRQGREDASAQASKPVRSVLLNVKIVGTILLAAFAAATLWNALAALTGAN